MVGHHDREGLSRNMVGQDGISLYSDMRCAWKYGGHAQKDTRYKRCENSRCIILPQRHNSWRSPSSNVFVALAPPLPIIVPANLGFLVLSCAGCTKLLTASRLWLQTPRNQRHQQHHRGRHGSRYTVYVIACIHCIRYACFIRYI